MLNLEERDVDLPDNRLFERFSVHFPAKFKDSRENYGDKILLRNASALGVSLATRERLYINDNVTLEVSLPDSDDPLVLRGRVMWSKQLEESVWEAGVKFHHVHLVQISRLYKFTVGL